MEFKNLNTAIDKHLGPFCNESIREELIAAATIDMESITDFEDALPRSFADKDWIISKYNEVFGKKSRTMSDAVLKKYKKVFSSFTKAEVELAMNAAKKDEFHISKKFHFCTIEYFSRIDQIDKWVNIAADKFNAENNFVLPKFNVREDI
jgi:hypothetical protein